MNYKNLLMCFEIVKIYELSIQPSTDVCMKKCYTNMLRRLITLIILKVDKKLI